jgi:hypothetical protein
MKLGFSLIFTQKIPTPMKKILVILAMLLSFNGFAQYDPWDPQWTKWIYGAGYISSGAQIRLSYLKDTLLLGQSCQILKREVIRYDYWSKTYSYDVWTNEVTYYKSGVAYIFNGNKNKFDTLYYFSANINDRYSITSKRGADHGYAVVVDTGSVKIDSRKLKWQAVDYHLQTQGSGYTLRDTIVERIGSTECYYLPWDEINGMLDFNEGGPLICCEDWTFGSYLNYGKGVFSNNGTGCEFDFKLGISAKKSNLLTLYPNPSDLEFSINFKNKLVNHSISIYSTSGQLIKSIESKTTNDKIKINTSSWRNGLYVVTISNKFGSQKEKVFVKHPNCNNP